MIEPRFCNYNKDYQQRLGFLKVVTRVGQSARGGPEEILDRVQALYPGERRAPLTGRQAVPFDPKALIRDERVPSWIVGFVPKTLDRLVTWAQMVGLLAQSGRMSEWATILAGIGPPTDDNDWSQHNPFVLSTAEKAFFLQLLFFHDNVLPFLVARVGQLDAGVPISVAESCVYVTQALGDLLDQVKGNSPAELQLRLELRNLLERIGKQYRLDDPRQLVNSETRQDIAKCLVGDRIKGVRVRLAEYHAISRFEQLTDLGLLTKDDPNSSPPDREQREKVRTSWTWFVSPGLPEAARLLDPSIGGLEAFFRNSWIRFCATVLGQRAHELDFLADQRDIASLLDDTLPLARRQLGPIQVHTWASLTCLRALEKGYLLELSTVEKLLEALRSDQRTASTVRLSGRAELRGRTAAVPKTGLSELLKDNTLGEGGEDGKRSNDAD